MFAPPRAPEITPAQAMMPAGMAFMEPPDLATNGILHCERFSGGLFSTQKKHCAAFDQSTLSPDVAHAWMSFFACPPSQETPRSANGQEVLPDAEPFALN